MIKSKSIYGAICAHGLRKMDDSYIVIPKGIDFLTLPVAEGETLEWAKQITDSDFSVLSTKAGRSFIDPNFFNEKPYYAGFVVKNIDLNFCTEWKDDDICFTTGIITHGKVDENIIDKKIFANDEEMKNYLMRSHDESIYLKDALWRKRKDLGQVLDQIISSGKGGGYYGIFCRSISTGYVEKIPSFFTVKITKEHYYTDFHSLLEKLDNYTTESFTLDKLHASKLKIRITCSELVNLIKQKLSKSCIISSFDFHAVIQITHTKLIPIECVIFALESKLLNLSQALCELNKSTIKISSDIENPDVINFGEKIEKLCQLFKKSIHKYLDTKHLDLIIYIAEKISQNEVVSAIHYINICKIAKHFQIN